jgi:hypothetical protein
MVHKKAKIYTLILLVFCCTAIHAQEAIPASGGDATGSGGSASYSVGQLVYTTNTGTNGSVSQGVEQVQVTTVSGIDIAKGISLQCMVYPNPVVENLTLRIGSNELNISQLSYQLYDYSGKNLEIKQLTGNETNITVSSLAPATYFLKVIQSNKVIKTFKIIKN